MNSNGQQVVMSAWPVVLPHGPSFQLIDRVLRIGLREVEAEGHYTGQGIIDLQDHFPQNPLMAGILVAEAIAQTAIQYAQQLPELDGAFFQVVKWEAEITDQISPPAIIRYTAILDEIKRVSGRAHGWAEVNGRRVAEASFRFAIVRPNG